MSNQILVAVQNVMRAVTAIEKDKTNKFQDFDYRSIDGAMKAMQGVFVEQGIVLEPNYRLVKTFVRQGSKGEAINVIVSLTVLLRSTADDSHMACRVLGMGEDKLDKAVAKAHADAYKQFLFKMFCIPVEDEPENEKDGGAQRHQPEVRQTTKQPSRPANAIRDVRAEVANVFDRTRADFEVTKAAKLKALKAEYDRLDGMVKFAESVGDSAETLKRIDARDAIRALANKVNKATTLKEMEAIDG